MTREKYGDLVGLNSPTQHENKATDLLSVEVFLERVLIFITTYFFWIAILLIFSVFMLTTFYMRIIVTKLGTEKFKAKNKYKI